MKIELNKQLDKQVYCDFREAFVGGVDFGSKILRDHPKITIENHNQYIDEYYHKHNRQLNIILSKTITSLKDVEKILFLELMKYFDHDYSKDNYICYLSIFDCNPRYLETKSFQVYYKRPDHLRKEVVAHELTHFAFYDYCFNRGLKESKELWELSEIFNVLFLNIPSIQEAIGAEELLFYPVLKEKLEKIRKLWNMNLDAEKFIFQSLDLLVDSSILNN